jgi:hypothetical protein
MEKVMEIVKEDSWYHRNKEKASEQAKARYQKNKDHIKARAKKWKEENPERVKEIEKKFREKHRDKLNEQSRAWRKANPEKTKAWRDNIKEWKKEYDKEYRIKNKDTVKANKKAWYENNKQLIFKQTREFNKQNRHLVNARQNKYRSDKDNRTPKWLDKEDLWLIKQAYELAQIRRKLFKTEWHVDHIIPLRGDNVSGLHIIDNIQVIPKLENILKNNKYEIVL